MPGKADNPIRVKFDTVYLNPDDLIVYEKNNKDHPEEQVLLIMESIKNYGFTNSLIVDSKNVLIAWHGRHAAAKRLGLTEIPCQVRDDLTPKQVDTYRLLDNKIAELSKDNKANILFELKRLEDFALAALYPNLDPFKDDDADKEAIEDEAPGFRNKYVVQKGDIFQLWDHYLMCGDSSNKEMVAALMDNQKADMIFTDPPYNVAYQGKGKNTSNGIKNDDMSELEFESMLREWFLRYRENVKEGGGGVCLPLNKHSSIIPEAHRGRWFRREVSARMEQTDSCDGMVWLPMETWAFFLLWSKRQLNSILRWQNQHYHRRLSENRRSDTRCYQTSKRSWEGMKDNYLDNEAWPRPWLCSSYTKACGTYRIRSRKLQQSMRPRHGSFLRFWKYTNSLWETQTSMSIDGTWREIYRGDYQTVSYLHKVRKGSPMCKPPSWY